MYKIRYRVAGGDKWQTIGRTPLETEIEALRYACARLSRILEIGELILVQYDKHIWTVASASIVVGFIKLTQV